MTSSHEFLKNLALVLCVAAVTTVLSRRLKLPGVFGYLVAGMVVGPHTVIPFFADLDTIQTLAEVGVILLMYTLGLEFRLGSVVRVAATSGLAALAETTLMFGLGYTAGTLLGWTSTEAATTGALVAISSTTIIAQVFSERGVTGRVRHTVFGILIVEDLIAILLIAVLSAAGVGDRLSSSQLFVTGIRLTTFLIALVALGRLLVPRFIRFVNTLGSPEAMTVASVGLSFACALLALTAGYSVALGAFIAGSLVAESGLGEAIAHRTLPIRDLFVAIFFVSVGMMIEPTVLLTHWVAILVLVCVVVVGKVAAVTFGTFLTGHGLRESVQSGLSLAQIGEFSFIIAGVGIAGGTNRGFLLPVAVAVSAITTLLTPMLVTRSLQVAGAVDRALPPALQTFVSLYGSWFAGLTRPTRHDESPLRRAIWWIVADVALLAGLIIAATAEMGRLAVMVEVGLGWPSPAGRLVVVGLSVMAAAPFVAGLIRMTRTVATTLAQRSMPTPGKGRLDRAFAPRAAFVATLHYGLLVCCALPLFALLLPLAPEGTVAVLAVVLAVSGVVAVWRSASALYGHARAGAEVIVMALTQHDRLRADDAQLQRSMEQVSALLPGLGDPESWRMAHGDPGVGRTLAELNLRGNSGAHVLAILRSQGAEMESITPTGNEKLQDGDVLAVAGAPGALRAAREILLGER